MARSAWRWNTGFPRLSAHTACYVQTCVIFCSFLDKKKDQTSALDLPDMPLLVYCLVSITNTRSGICQLTWKICQREAISSANDFLHPPNFLQGQRNLKIPSTSFGGCQNFVRRENPFFLDIHPSLDHQISQHMNNEANPFFNFDKATTALFFLRRRHDFHDLTDLDKASVTLLELYAMAETVCVETQSRFVLRDEEGKFSFYI